MLVAVAADVDARTVERYLGTDEPMKPSTTRRIENALRTQGHGSLLRAERLRLARAA
jgi:DNA-binding LacI/PurR family transcriptional regulator